MTMTRHDTFVQTETSATAQWFSRTRRIWPLVGVLLLALVAAFVGLGVAPLDSHEIFVVQTAKEMRQRCDWIIPYFNGQPRLNKPPLNYWLTDASSTLFHDGGITDIDGRIPSAVAGVWMVMMTVWCGRMLFNRSVGLWAGALLATTIGFGEYAHSARPEMTYASLCVTALALFIASWRMRNRGWKQRMTAWGMWACFGFATLAKGPHIPAAFLLGFVLALAWHPPSRSRIPSVLCPLSGMVILMAIAAPWWWAMRAHLGMATLSESELVGHRFRLSPLNILDPYYLYRTWGLLLPWIPLFPGAACFIFKRSRHGYAARFLGILILTGMVTLGFGGGKRWYYMLPYAAPLAILMALALRDAMAIASQWLNRSRTRTIMLALLAVGMLASVWTLATLDPSRAAPHAGASCVMMLGVMAYIVASRLSSYPATERAQARMIGLGVVMLAGLTSSTIRVAAVMNSSDGWSRAAFGQLVNEQVPPGDIVEIFDLEPAFVIYHSQQPVHIIRDLEDWIDLPAAHDRRWLCFPSSRLHALSGHVSLAHRYEVAQCDDGQSWILALISPPVTGANSQPPLAMTDPLTAGSHLSPDSHERPEQ